MRNLLQNLHTRMLLACVVIGSAGAIAIAACSVERERGDGSPSSGVHPAGFANPGDEDFHGRALERIGWDLDNCAGCHGTSFDGGAANVTCRDCHAKGPDACDTCHREDTGSHPQHFTSGVACAECHLVPDRWDAEGHVRIGGEPDRAPAEIRFGARAAATIDPAHREGPPTYADGTCTNVACHGDALHDDGGGLSPEPRWSEPAPTGTCVRCHGNPPPDHASDRCTSCHPSNAPHVDGVLQVGRTNGCDGCHGSAASWAPPVDLSGNTFTTAIGVGAHQAHLRVPSRLRGPITCETCHRVPAMMLDTGHIDSPPPAEVEASLGWDRGAQQCAAWCHGPARPVWTTAGGASCGSCHGIPPSTPAHDASMPLTTCATCHPRSISPSGAILVDNNGKSEHIDGDVDLQ